MKKIVAIMLAIITVLTMAACGSINKTEVSVLWADRADTKLPNSLENAMDKAMYMESISYAYYDANGDQAAQTQQASEVLEKGCAVLMVNLVDAAAAQEIVELAKAKNIPVIFFGCEVDAAVVSGYDKCVNVYADSTTAVSTLATLLDETVNDEEGKNLTSLDKNKDGKVNYAVYGSVDVSSVENLAISGEALEISEAKNAGDLVDSVEMIITETDEAALDVLVALQAKGYNKGDKTKFIPLYTIGSRYSAKTHFAEEFNKEYASTEEADKAKIEYTIIEKIGEGAASGAVSEDFHSICSKAAAAARAFIKGESIADAIIKVPFVVAG